MELATAKVYKAKTAKTTRARAISTKSRKREEQQKKKKKKKERGAGGKGREAEGRERNPSLQITNPPKKPGARYTKTFSAGPNASHGANDAPPPRAARLYTCGTQVGHRRGCTLQSNPRKRGGKELKKLSAAR